MKKYFEFIELLHQKLIIKSVLKDILLKKIRALILKQ